MPFRPPLADPSLQRYRDYARQRQMTLGDLLLENRIVFLEGVINDAAANLTVMKFLFLQYENRTQGISFYINSPGGSVTQHAGDLRHDAVHRVPDRDLLHRPGRLGRGGPAGGRHQGPTVLPCRTPRS